MGIDKQMYLSTVVSTQEEVRLDEKKSKHANTKNSQFSWNW